MNKALGIFLVALLSLAASAQKPTEQPELANLTGSYTITWLGGGQPNKITLTEKKLDIVTLSGIYTADNGDACPISGTRTGVDFSLIVSCKQFEIHLSGYELHNARTNSSSGTYQYLVYREGSWKGSFVMDKIVE